MASKRDYEAVAQAFRAIKPKGGLGEAFNETVSWGQAVSKVAGYFSETNPNFDYVRFMEAAGFYPTKEEA